MVQAVYRQPSMIPKVIHYCWFGGGEMPELAKRCMTSWRQHMPESEWKYCAWTEDTFDLTTAPTYVQQAYECRKFAFVSDYVRLWALEQYGGIYMDVDFEVYKSFAPLLNHPFIAGFDGSKRKAVMMGVIGSEPHGIWVTEMLHTYDDRSFILPDGTCDMRPNTGYFTDMLEAKGLVCDGVEKDFGNMMHIYPTDYFCPTLTTGESILSNRTYCDHLGLNSWTTVGWKGKLLGLFPQSIRIKLIKLKRWLLE